MEIEVHRSYEQGDSAIGSFDIDGQHFCYSLEDKVREIDGQPVESWKVPKQTAIPRGRYRVIIDHSNRFGCDMPHVLDVPGFAGIRIHVGNDADDVEGCIALGMGQVGDRITHSRDAFNAFMPLLRQTLDSGEEVWITVS